MTFSYENPIHTYICIYFPIYNSRSKHTQHDTPNNPPSHESLNMVSMSGSTLRRTNHTSTSYPYLPIHPYCVSDSHWLCLVCLTTFFYTSTSYTQITKLLTTSHIASTFDNNERSIPLTKSTCVTKACTKWTLMFQPRSLPFIWSLTKTRIYAPNSKFGSGSSA